MTAPRLLFALVLTFIPSQLFAGGAAPPPPPSAQEIAKWVKQLGDGDFVTREAASKRLWEAGRAAEPALQAALKESDPEVVRRSQELLDKFRWGIYPDTPKQVVDLIAKYQAVERASKQQIVHQLLELGGPGVTALLKMAEAETNEEIRKELTQLVADEAPRIVPQLLKEGNHSVLAQLLDLDLKLNPDRDAAITNYGAYYLVRGQHDGRIGLDARIVYFRARLGDKELNPPAELMLAHLYRIQGDYKAAREMAEKAGKKDILLGILYEQGDWKELAKRGAGTPGEESNALEALGFRAAYQRLAGDRDGFEKTIAELRERTKARPTQEDELDWQCAKALLLNERTRDALDMLGDGPHAERAFEILCAQLRFKEAFALVDKVRAGGKKYLPTLEMLQARALALRLGEKAKAAELFARLGGDVRADGDGAWYANLLEAEVQSGMAELAVEQCGRMLAVPWGQESAAVLLGKIFPERGEAAAFWWHFLRVKFPKEEPAATMKRLRQVLDGKLPQQELTAWMPEADGKLTDDEREAGYTALADACLAAHLEERAQEYLEKAAGRSKTPPALLRLADHLAEKKAWAAAAEQYGKAWEREPRMPLALYLRGWALAQAGQETEGKRLMDLAHALPLGNDYPRYEFMEELRRRGQAEAARRECEFLATVQPPGSPYAGSALRYLGNEALRRNEFQKAADMQQRALLRVLYSYVNFVQTPGYVVAPALVHRCRARALLDSGDFEQAAREAALNLELLPGDVELPITLAAEMEKKGHAREGEQLYDRVASVYEKLLVDYPKSALAHNSLGWLAARCNRHLDKGLIHSQKAVELAPDNAGYLDTLAELHFQRGDKEKALELAGKCLQVEPKNEYFQKQKKRFEAGDKTAPLPEGGD